MSESGEGAAHESPGAVSGPDPGLLDALLADTSDLAAVFDPDLRCRYLNAAGQRLLGAATSDAVAALRLPSIMAHDDAARLEVEVLPQLEVQGDWAGQIMMQRRSGVEIPTRSTVRRRSDGTITWVARDLTNDKAVMQRIHKRAFFDDLTNLPHRSLFLDKLDLEMRRLQDRASPVAVLFVNLDRFKEKNDRLGHDAGDQLLKDVAHRLPAALTEDRDTLARWGSDEFVILREQVQSDDDGIALAEAVAKVFEEPFRISGTPVFLTSSVGIAIASPGEVSPDELLRHADAACQFAKLKGGGNFHLFDEEMRHRAQRRASVEEALRGAAQRGELVLHFQPEVLLRSNAIVATEALVRWNHPQWGLVAPVEFIPVAEASGLILEIGDFVLAEGMRQCKEWSDQFPDRPVGVAINLSGRQFREDHFVEGIAEHLSRANVDPGLICLEITESVLMDDLEETAKTLRRLKDLGVRLAVDDFGTGYSSLEYLRRFPVDILKVDQSFVAGLGHDPEDSAIVQAVISMGRALGLMTVAEGVETAHHLIELRELRCDIAQGYHFARPTPAAEVTRLLEAGDDWLELGS